jgi:hypothetical protein
MYFSHYLHQLNVIRSLQQKSLGRSYDALFASNVSAYVARLAEIIGPYLIISLYNIVFNFREKFLLAHIPNNLHLSDINPEIRTVAIFLTLTYKNMY